MLLSVIKKRMWVHNCFRSRKSEGEYWTRYNSSHVCPPNFLSTHYHRTSYLTCHTIPHIYAQILLIFHAFLKTKTGNTSCMQTIEVQGRRRKTAHTIGIEEAQTSPDPFRHGNHSRSATETGRNRDITETFLSVWTTPFNYTGKIFTEWWRSMTKRKRDV
jgi:hypothetical protein